VNLKPWGDKLRRIALVGWLLHLGPVGFELRQFLPVRSFFRVC